MRPLPYDDPGQPDVSSPARFLIWTGRQQIPTLLLGVVYGVIWMVAQALVPAAIGRGLQTGVADGDLSAAAQWSLVVLALALIQAVFGILRHRVAVANWLAASFRAMQLLGRHSSQVGVAIRRRLPTGEIVAAATNDALRLGGAFDVTARLSGAIVSYAVVAVLLLRTSVLLGLVVLIGVPTMVLLLGPLLRPLQRRQHDQREVAGHLTALGADTVAGLRVLRGIGGEPAFLHRYRTRSRELEKAGRPRRRRRRPPWTPPRCCCRASSWSWSPGSAPGSRSRAPSTSATSSRSTGTPSSWSSRSVRRSRRPTSSPARWSAPSGSWPSW